MDAELLNIDLLAGKNVKIDVVRDTSCLTITDVEPSDSGKYTVVVENELGRDTCASSVTVDGSFTSLNFQCVCGGGEGAEGERVVCVYAFVCDK